MRRSLAQLAVLLLAVLVAACGGAEGRKVRYLEKGEEYFAARNYEKARIEFRNALQIDPNDANVRYQVGRVAEKLNNPREAVGHYQAAIDLDPNLMPARAALARLVPARAACRTRRWTWRSRASRSSRRTRSC